jgi:hypothetical protein
MRLIIVLTLIVTALLPGTGKVLAGELPEMLQEHAWLCVRAQQQTGLMQLDLMF